jgi:hypothetical protein
MGKKKAYGFITLALVFIAALFVFSCDDESISRALGEPVSHTYTIKYEITGTASSVSITMENSGGNTEQFSSVSLPWSTAFTVTLNDKYDWFFVYVSAQNNGSSGAVTATIYKDNHVLETATSSGAYVIATASGSIDY